MVAALCGLLLAGCVTVPTSGRVQSVNVTQGGSGGGQYYLQPIPVPPGQGWSPQQIVSGFLAANASFASGHAVAREYLIPSASRTWHPGWAVKVFGQSPSIVTPVRSPYSGKTAATTVVEVSGPVLGSRLRQRAVRDLIAGPVRGAGEVPARPPERGVADLQPAQRRAADPG